MKKTKSKTPPRGNLALGIETIRLLRAYQEKTGVPMAEAARRAIRAWPPMCDDEPAKEGGK